MKTALILAGHGSHISSQTAGLVWRQVDRLRALGVADEITAAFWKEMPSFARVLDTTTAKDVTIIPLFTAKGYFTQTVIPAEMRLEGALTQRDGCTIRYTPSLNEHPYLAAVVRKRVEEALATYNLPPEATAVAVIGHSTRRNPDSRKATEAQAQKLRDARIAAQIEAVYLDDSPEIAEIYTLTNAPNLIAVPYFLAAGSHTTIDVPRELALKEGENYGVVENRQVFYTPPVGVDDDLLDVILALARDAGTPLTSPNRGDMWRRVPSAGREMLLEAIAASGVVRFGELHLTTNEVRVWGDEVTSEIITNPAALRAKVRESPFRSLATANGLPGGWRVPIEKPEQLHAVVETIYPGAVAHWAAAQSGTLRLSPLQATVARQTGMYRALADLPNEAQAETVKRVCTGCACHPLWFSVEKGDKLPCPEPCNHWLSAALEERP
jgi:sirohydrochlorin cobaltochelatase